MGAGCAAPKKILPSKPPAMDGRIEPDVWWNEPRSLWQLDDLVFLLFSAGLLVAAMVLVGKSITGLFRWAHIGYRLHRSGIPQGPSFAEAMAGFGSFQIHRIMAKWMDTFGSILWYRLGPYHVRHFPTCTTKPSWAQVFYQIDCYRLLTGEVCSVMARAAISRSQRMWSLLFAISWRRRIR